MRDITPCSFSRTQTNSKRGGRTELSFLNTNWVELQGDTVDLAPDGLGATLSIMHLANEGEDILVDVEVYGVDANGIEERLTPQANVWGQQKVFDYQLRGNRDVRVEFDNVGIGKNYARVW